MGRGGVGGLRIQPSNISDFLVCLYYAVPLKIAWRERWGCLAREVGSGGGVRMLLGPSL